MFKKFLTISIFLLHTCGTLIGMIPQDFTDNFLRNGILPPHAIELVNDGAGNVAYAIENQNAQVLLIQKSTSNGPQRSIIVNEFQQQDTTPAMPPVKFIGMSEAPEIVPVQEQPQQQIIYSPKETSTIVNQPSQNPTQIQDSRSALSTPTRQEAFAATQEFVARQQKQQDAQYLADTVASESSRQSTYDSMLNDHSQRTWHIIGSHFNSISDEEKQKINASTPQQLDTMLQYFWERSGKYNFQTFQEFAFSQFRFYDCPTYLKHLEEKYGEEAFDNFMLRTEERIRTDAQFAHDIRHIGISGYKNKRYHRLASKVLTLGFKKNLKSSSKDKWGSHEFILEQAKKARARIEANRQKAATEERKETATTEPSRQLPPPPTPEPFAFIANPQERKSAQDFSAVLSKSENDPHEQEELRKLCADLGDDSFLPLKKETIAELSALTTKSSPSPQAAATEEKKEASPTPKEETSTKKDLKGETTAKREGAHQPLAEKSSSSSQTATLTQKKPTPTFTQAVTHVLKKSAAAGIGEFISGLCREAIHGLFSHETPPHIPVYEDRPFPYSITEPLAHHAYADPIASACLLGTASRDTSKQFPFDTTSHLQYMDPIARECLCGDGAQASKSLPSFQHFPQPERRPTQETQFHDPIALPDDGQSVGHGGIIHDHASSLAEEKRPEVSPLHPMDVTATTCDGQRVSSSDIRRVRLSSLQLIAQAAAMVEGHPCEPLVVNACYAVETLDKIAKILLTFRDDLAYDCISYAHVCAQTAHLTAASATGTILGLADTGQDCLHAAAHPIQTAQSIIHAHLEFGQLLFELGKICFDPSLEGHRIETAQHMAAAVGQKITEKLEHMQQASVQDNVRDLSHFASGVRAANAAQQLASDKLQKLAKYIARLQKIITAERPTAAALGAAPIIENALEKAGPAERTLARRAETASQATRTAEHSPQGLVQQSRAAEFEKKIFRMPPGERVAAIRIEAEAVAKSRGLEFEEFVSKRNKRIVYRDPSTKNLYSVDTQHGRFEMLNRKGKHLGEVNFDFNLTKGPDKSGMHDLEI
jgi:hypothetical protein